MTMRRIRVASLVVWLAVGCAGTTQTASINGPRIQAADSEPQSWLTHGRTYSEQRFSPLARVTTANVNQLGLAWSHDIKARSARGVEATPIVVDGVMYATGAWSHVLALDAKTGRLLWEFDPQVSGAYGAKGCCDIVNRGVAGDSRVRDPRGAAGKTAAREPVAHHGPTMTCSVTGSARS